MQEIKPPDCLCTHNEGDLFFKKNTPKNSEIKTTIANTTITAFIFILNFKNLVLSLIIIISKTGEPNRVINPPLIIRLRPP